MSAVHLRISAATVLLGVVGYSLLPYATSYVSTSAVVNAPIISVRAPFDGVIVAQSKEVASAVLQGETLLNLHNSRSQRTEIQALQTSHGALSGEISGIEKQIKDLERLGASLTVRRVEQVAARLSWLGPQLAEATADIARSETRINLARTSSARMSRLSANGLAIQSATEGAEAELAAASADLAKQQALQARLKIEQDMLRNV